MGDDELAGQVVDGAELDRLHGGREARESCQHHDLQAGSNTQQGLDELNAGIVAKTEVQYRLVRLMLFRTVECLISIVGSKGLQIVSLKGAAKRAAEGLVVIDDQDLFHRISSLPPAV